MLSTLVSLIIFLIVISVLVFVHELGHFLAAKLVGVKVEEFALGFGPTLIKKEYKQTVFKLNAIPLGGYVKLYGDRSNKNPDLTKEAYNKKPFYAKAIILLAGVTFNYIFAIFIAFLYLSNVNGRVQLLKQGDYTFSASYNINTIVDYILPGSIADNTLLVNDELLTIDGQPVSNINIPSHLKDDQDGKVSLQILRDGVKQDLDLALNEDRKIGIAYSTIYNITYPVNIFNALGYANDLFGYQATVLINSLLTATSTGNTTELGNNVGSIVSVGVAIDSIISSGQVQLMGQLLIALSLALVLFNLFPIPALDGGQLLIEALESLLRRKLPESVEMVLAASSFIFLIGLSILLIIKDLNQFNFFNQIINGIRTILGR